MLRSILSVVAGVVTWSILWVTGNAVIAMALPGSFKDDGTTDSAAVLLGIAAFSVALSLLSGYVTSMLSKSQGLGQVVAVGLLLLAIGIAVQMQYWDLMPLWYHLTFLGLLVPGVLAGGKLRLARTPA